MIYRVRENNFETNDIDDVIWHCMEDDYHEEDDVESYVNDSYGPIYINGETYYAYDILVQFGHLDDYLYDYREMMNENDLTNARYELQRARAGDTVYIQNYTVDVLEENSDEDGDDIEVIVEDLRCTVEELQALRRQKADSDAENQKSYLEFFQVI